MPSAVHVIEPEQQEPADSLRGLRTRVAHVSYEEVSQEFSVSGDSDGGLQPPAKRRRLAHAVVRFASARCNTFLASL